jgi:hypothetical protein
MQRDLIRAAETLTEREVRFLVDSYYQMQEFRKRSSNQSSALTGLGEPHEILDWYQNGNFIMEQQLAKALDEYSSRSPLGSWARSQVGIGPIIAAGLLAHVRVDEKVPTAGHIWRFAGLSPDVEWLGNAKAQALVKEQLGERKKVTPEDAYDIAQRINRKLHLPLKDYKGEEQKLTNTNLINWISRRPWNARLKVLCWKIGESFVKTSSKEDAFYGHIYLERKALETEKNEDKAFAKQAAHILETKNIGKSTEAYKAYSQGMLPKAHIYSRAKRYAVKLFLSHYHHVGYCLTTDKLPPLPYPIAQMGHAHLINPPKWEMIHGPVSV